MSRAGIVMNTNQLCVGFRNGRAEKVLFENLELRLREGELVCFMGPNGIGKSSLIRTLAGLQDPLSGVVSIPGKERKDFPKMISVVLTNSVSRTNLSVRDLVAFGRYPYLSWDIRLSVNDEKIVDHAIESINIQHLADAQVSQLSDGQMQMVMIARSLAQDTPIILLDEPTAHLDLNNRIEIMKLLRRLSRELKKTILVSTHELDLALQTADLVWLAGNNLNIQTGIPEDLVLDGSFDSIFKFKGFDLRTGKLTHENDVGPEVILLGSGPVYLWTRNALERAGLRISSGPVEQNDPKAVTVSIDFEESKPRWILKRDNRLITVSTIAELIKLM